MKHLILLILISLTLSGCSSFYDLFGGNFHHGPLESIETTLSPEALQLVQQAYQGVEKPFDHHVHLVGKDNGNYVNPSMTKWYNLTQYFRYRLYISAGGVTDLEIADEQYVERLVNLIRSIPNHGKFALYAMDKYYLPNGQADLEKTTFYIPNENVFRVVEQYPECFVPVISVNPYRPDAIEELEKWAAKGCRFVKWLPNAMGIDPSDNRITQFYETMIKHNMVLLSHTGKESAVDATEDQRLGNPLLLRKPLDMGLQVVALHVGTDGEGEDLDNPGQQTTNFELVIRLLENPKYTTNLRAELAAITLFNRMDCLDKLLERTDLHPRFINGSDYPIPAINCIIWLKRLQRLGFITRQERHALKEIYKYNPLLFDFVLKRTLKHPTTGAKFADSIFSSPF